MSQPHPILVVIGPPGAGKSVVGRMTARLLNASFVDTDQQIVKRFGDISTIFAEQGEPAFRQIERDEVARALGTSGVVALGGGSVLNKDTQQDLASQLVAYISVSADAVQSRIRNQSRPLLREGIDSWQTIMNDRREIYEQLATNTFDSSHRSAGSIAHELAAWVQQEGTK